MNNVTRISIGIPRAVDVVLTAYRNVSMPLRRAAQAHMLDVASTTYVLYVLLPINPSSLSNSLQLLCQNPE
jgi:hypothetical protein